jgi:MFS family permease
MSRSPVVMGLFGSTVLISLSQAMTAAAAPILAHRFGRLDLIAWLMGGYLLAATASGPLFGKAGDLYGRRVVLQVALVVVLVASLACGFAWSMPSLIAFRTVQGIGGGGLITVASAAVADVLPVADRSHYQGVITASTSATTVAGPVIGGLLIDQVSWRWVFLINPPIIILLLDQLRRMPPTRRRPVDADHVGAALLVTGVGALMVAAQVVARTHSWSRAPALATLGAAGVLLLAFLARERVAPDPVVPLQLFADRTFAVCALLSLFAGATLFAGSLQLQQYLQIGLGKSPTSAGLQMLPLFTTLALTSIMSGRRLSRQGRAGQHLLVGTAATALGLILLTGLARDATRPALTGGMLWLGCGLGVLLPTLSLVTQTTVHQTQLGAATSVIMLLRTLGGAVGTAVVGSMVAARLTTRPVAAASALTAGFPALAGFAVLAIITALVTRQVVVPGLGPRHRALGRPPRRRRRTDRRHGRGRCLPGSEPVGRRSGSGFGVGRRSGSGFGVRGGAGSGFGVRGGAGGRRRGEARFGCPGEARLGCPGRSGGRRRGGSGHRRGARRPRDRSRRHRHRDRCRRGIDT